MSERKTAEPPAISVIVPIRNRSGTRLRNCLASLRWQDCGEPVEVVLSDFGSDPGHAASVAELAAEFDATLVRTDTAEIWNRSKALNIGIRAAAADVVMCTDADMLFAPGFIAGVIARWREEGDGIVVSRCHDLPDDVPEQPWQRGDFSALLGRASLRDTTGTGACQAARKSFFEHARGYDEAFKYWGAEDDDMLSRAGRSGLEVRWLDGSAQMLHQWHPTMKNDKWLQRRINKWRMRFTRHVVVKNPRGWGGVEG